MSTLRMAHTHDPRDELLQKLGSVDHINVFHNQILVAIYIRPEKTKGGVFLADKTRGEDQYQGKVGLVLKKGPLAFCDDAQNKFEGQNVEIGDWIGYRIQDGWSLGVAGAGGQIQCRMLEDVHIRLKLTHPDDIY